MPAFAEHQPRDGDVVLFCAGVDPGSNGLCHWIYTPKSVGFAHADGVEGRTHWLVLCQACAEAYASADRYPPEFAHGFQEGVYEGNRPCVLAPS